MIKNKRYFYFETTDSPRMKKIPIRVECSAGHRGEQIPHTFHLKDRDIEVVEVFDSWLALDHRYFKVKGHDGGLYILRHDVPAEEWEVTFSEWPLSHD